MGANDLVERTLEFLRRRKSDYQLAFGFPRIVATLRRAYLSVFGGPAGQRVLNDLAEFCRANETTFHPSQDDATRNILEGRRQVWIRITQHLHLKPNELFALSNNQEVTRLIKIQGEDDG